MTRASTVVGLERRHRRRRGVVVGLVLAAIAFATFCVSVSVGDFPIPLPEVVPALFGFGDRDAHFIVHTLRLPRALVGLLAGAAFGFSGAIFQSLARNPLASPDIIGISAGAAAGAVAAIVLAHAGSTDVALAAFGSALLTALAIYVLAYKRGVSAYRLVLVGIGIGAVLTSVTSYLLTRADIYEAARAQIWLVGSLNGRSWSHVRPLVLVLLVLTPVILLLARPMRALQLGDDTARGLGTAVNRARTSLIIAGVALAAVATASAGPIAFVAFVAPAIARRLLHTSGFTLLPAALMGSTLVLAADLVGRQMFKPTGLPVGVITALIGAPYLLWLLARANRIGVGG